MQIDEGSFSLGSKKKRSSQLIKTDEKNAYHR